MIIGWTFQNVPLWPISPKPIFLSACIPAAVLAVVSAGAESETPQSLTDSNIPVSWDQIQTKYRITSQKLAKLIQYQLNSVRQPADTKIQGAPLLVLEGADMPAVAIEIGNLSNLNAEKALGDTEFLAVIARAIAKGIDAFFAEKSQ
jgi:N-acetylmuramoyl-L-alanine amidase